MTLPVRSEIMVLGVSHESAPVELREALRVSPHELLATDGVTDATVESVVLSTCNRFELYFASGKPEEAEQHWIQRLTELSPRWRQAAAEGGPAYRMNGERAVRHLLRVACGLESSVLGDVQILGQIRRAVDESRSHGRLGVVLDTTFDVALRTGRRGRHETKVSQGAASIGSALVCTLDELVDSGAVTTGDGRLRVCVLGAGEIARKTIGQLAESRHPHVTIVNRDPVKARRLARQWDAAWSEWSRWFEIVTRSDVIVAATSATSPILTRSRLDRIWESRRENPPVVIDAGMPRNAEPGSRIRVIDIDAIRERRTTTLQARERCIPDVERIVNEELESWVRFWAFQSTEASLRELYQRAFEVSRQAAHELANASELDVGSAEKIVMKSIKRVLHTHVRELRRTRRARPPCT